MKVLSIFVIYIQKLASSFLGYVTGFKQKQHLVCTMTDEDFNQRSLCNWDCSLFLFLH